MKGMTQRALFHYVENKNRQPHTNRSHVAIERDAIAENQLCRLEQL